MKILLGSSTDNVENAGPGVIRTEIKNQGMADMDNDMTGRIEKMNVRLAEMRGYL